MRECFEPGPALVQLEACVEELSSTAARFAAARDEAMGSLAAHLRPRLRAMVTELLGDVAKGSAATALGDKYVSQSVSPSIRQAVGQSGRQDRQAVKDRQ